MDQVESQLLKLNANIDKIKFRTRLDNSNTQDDIHKVGEKTIDQIPINIGDVSVISDCGSMDASFEDEEVKLPVKKSRTQKVKVKTTSSPRRHMAQETQTPLEPLSAELCSNSEAISFKTELNDTPNTVGLNSGLPPPEFFTMSKEVERLRIEKSINEAAFSQQMMQLSAQIEILSKENYALKQDNLRKHQEQLKLVSIQSEVSSKDHEISSLKQTVSQLQAEILESRKKEEKLYEDVLELKGQLARETVVKSQETAYKEAESRNREKEIDVLKRQVDSMLAVRTHTEDMKSFYSTDTTQLRLQLPRSPVSFPNAESHRSTAHFDRYAPQPTLQNEGLDQQLFNMQLKKKQLEEEIEKIEIHKQTIMSKKRKDEIHSEMSGIDGQIQFLKNKIRGTTSFVPC